MGCGGGGSTLNAQWKMVVIAQRVEMMMASTEGALAFVKGLCRAFYESCCWTLEGARLHHGTLNAVILPTVLRFNESTCSETYGRLRQAMRLLPNADVASEIEQLNADIGLPGSLSEMGLSEDLIEDMVPHAVSDLYNDKP